MGHVGAKGLARGRSHAVRPWPDKEAYEGKDGATNETLAIYFWQNRGTDVVIGMSGVVVQPRWRYSIYFWQNRGTDVVIGMSGVVVQPRWRYRNF